MFVEQLRRAVEASPRAELPAVSGLLWRAYAAGQVTEADASALSEMIEARRALPAAQKPVQRRLGSRPRSPASMERRRRWASCGALPPALASRFTLAEQAVLAVVAAEHQKHGACTLPIGNVAALAGVSETTVRNAMREARQLGFLHVEERRVSAWRNKPNRVTIMSREWLSWLRMRRKGVGANPCSPRVPENKKGTSAKRNRGWAAKGQGVWTAARTPGGTCQPRPAVHVRGADERAAFHNGHAEQSISQMGDATQP
jgi:hypothetical protein